ncbi:hypothetical protein Q3C01_12850 [Bradyrhizobium sp. UFLA05-109]
MGFFAISTLGLQAPLEVEACHISFWVLPRPWYRVFGYTFCLDVGLRFKSEAPLRRLRFVLPFDSEKSRIFDLSTIVLDQDFSPLIFGKPVTVTGDRVTYDGPLDGPDKISDRVVAVSPENSSAEQPQTGAAGFSIWTIELRDSTENDEWTYVRFRISARNPWRIWASKGWGLAKRGAVVDLRVCDIRESLLLGHGEAESAHLLPIKQLFLFLVAPSYFVPNHFSPMLHYTRLLEPKVWEQYLAGFSTHTDGAKFSIHQWRYTGETEISIDHPYRAYMDLSREFGREVFLYYVIAIISLPIVSHALEALGRKAWALLF